MTMFIATWSHRLAFSVLDVAIFFSSGIVFYISFFFFQAEDGIRDDLVTGVQTCALPIFPREVIEPMSPRTFARQFEGNFGTTPARWVRSLRVEAARQHLESRNLSLKEIEIGRASCRERV